MTTFVTPVPPATAMVRITPSAPVPTDPAMRFSGDLIQWIGLPAGTVISAFATGCIARASGGANGIPGQPADAWTAFQLSPLPQLDPAAFKMVTPGLPLQIVLVIGSAGATPAVDDLLDGGAPLVTAPPGAGSTAFLGFIFQDRLCRDPLSAAEAIAASNACDSNWPAFVTALAGLANGRTLRVLDHRGVPMSGISVDVSINGGAAQHVALTPAMDGDTGVVVPAASSATVSVPAWANSIVGGLDADTGAFAAPLTLPAGRRLVQVLNASDWFATPDPGVSLPIWYPNSDIEPLQDGNRYFARLVSDMRLSKGGGATQIAGWAVVKGSLSDSSVDWPLIPGDASTTIMALVNELRGNGGDIRMLLNQFLQFDSPTIDDFPELLPILCACFIALGPLQAFAHMNTDPAGYLVGFIGVATLSVLLTTGVTEDLLTKLAEYSKGLKDALDEIDPTIATWTPYPAAFSDNPLVSPPPFKILGHTIDDFSHLGVYHQKHVSIRQADGTRVAYLGGIDLNSDRPDTPLHRVRHPFHDLQVRVTGPAVDAVVRTYQERATVHSATAPIAPAAVPSPPGASHLVQIARTYYKPASPPGSFNAFAPNGESTPIRTIEAAIAQAKDFIYIEDQYFTPPKDYLDALVAAGTRGVKALMLTVNFATDQPYGSVRREEVLAQLQTAWGGRFHLGAPLRRFAHEVPGLTTNLGRVALTSALDAASNIASFGPPGRVPAPPFWAFIGNELVLVYALQGPATSTVQAVQIARAPATGGWGAQPVAHPVGTPVLAVQLPGIYVHAKMMIVDDVFLFAGSSNVNRRGFYHDGELDSFTVPQHLIGDPRNPARTLRARLMAEHLGISTEIGQALFADPHSAFPYFAGRSWYEQSHWRPLDFFGSLPPDVPIGTGGSAANFALQIMIGALRDAAKPDVWPLLADPTTGLDPNPSAKGPALP